jgi:hypothetical protein
MQPVQAISINARIGAWRVMSMAQSKAALFARPTVLQQAFPAK